MKRLDSVKIHLPGLDLRYLVRQEQLDECIDANLRNLDYANRTAIPRLEELVIGPFKAAIKAQTLLEASKTVGFERSGIIGEVGAIKDKFTLMQSFGKFNVESQLSPASSTSYAQLFNGFLSGVEYMVASNSSNIRRDGVIKKGSDVFISLDMVMCDLARLKIENTGKPYTKCEISLVDEVGKKVELDSQLSTLTLQRDSSQYSLLIPAASASYFASLSLRRRLKDFKASVVDLLRANYDCDSEGGHIEAHFDLEGGASARTLFFDKITVSYSKVFKALMNHTVAGVVSTGDFELIRRYASKPPCRNKRGKNELQVGTTSNEEGNLIFDIVRCRNGASSTRTYTILKTAQGNLYVSARNIQSNLDLICQQHSDKSRQTKVDFFPAYFDSKSRR